MRAVAGLLAGWALVTGPALAQTAPPLGFGASSPPPGLAASPPAASDQAPLSLSAFFGTDTRPIRSGIVWRVFDEDGTGHPTLRDKSSAAEPTFRLAPGRYIVHAAYGFASTSRRIVLGPSGLSDKLPIAAGALRLGGAVGEAAIPGNRIAFSIFVPVGNDSEARLVASNVRAGEIVRLPDGTYHVVSTYGESNAIMRVDLKVETGRLTEATINHRAATVTLKLVAAPGGEAFAGTAFSVLTPGGDTIREAIGAFPTVTLAEGDYVLIARHDGSVYTREFKVESGLDRDIEAITKTE